MQTRNRLLITLTNNEVNIVNNPILSQTAATDQSAPGKAWNVTLWALQALLAVAFLFFGGSKLAGTEMMVNVFENVGVGQWFRYVTGLLEVGGAVLLLIPALAGLGGLLLACVMVGATFAHLFVIGGSFVMPLVLLVLTLAVAWGRRRRTLRLAGQA